MIDRQSTSRNVRASSLTGAITEAMSRRASGVSTASSKLAEGVKDTFNGIRRAAVNTTKAATSSAAYSAPFLTLKAMSDIEKLAQKRGVNLAEERFKVTPEYAYPNTMMNREELREEMNRKSAYYHNLGLDNSSEEGKAGVGQISLEILQCFGLPKADRIGEASAFCIAVCGCHAFKTDVMPPVANPMWLRKMRRACIFPVHHAYAKLYVGVFGNNSENNKKDGFAGRVVIDLCRLRPNCKYDVTLPLRQSAHVYSREQRGAIRFRVHLQWYSERDAILSYLPRSIPKKIAPNEDVAVQCCDAKSFQNVARVVHGSHMPGRFTMKQLKATVREINLTRIVVLRHLRKRELRNLTQWRCPLISAFVFCAWMHCVYRSSMVYVPGHLITFLLLYLWKNYASYGLDSHCQNGFLVPTWEEMFSALVKGNNCIAPLEMEMLDQHHARSAMDDMKSAAFSETPESLSSALNLKDIAKAFREGMKVQTMRYRLKMYRNVFKGVDAVDFLVQAGYADSREEAVILGRRLARELKLFEHVVRKHRFKDEPLFYVFLSYDTNEYVMTTHKPRGTWLFRLLGLLPDTELTDDKAHLEMPYTDSVDHPRFTVKEAVYIRSKEGKMMLLNEQESQDEGLMSVSKTKSQQIADGLDELLEDEDNDIDTDNDNDNNEGASPQNDDENEQNELEGTEIKWLQPPPQQDINARRKGSSDAKMDQVLSQVRHNLHGLLFHLFNDRVYKIDDTTLRRTKLSRRESRSGLLGSRNTRGSSAESPSNAATRNPAAVLDEYDKLLGTGMYSHGNYWVSKIGIIVQPLVEMALQWLCLFRALFNVFTWRDPILSFWISIIGPLVVIVFHLFPWRLVLGIVGFALFGPQNLVLRLYREHKYGPDEFNPDKIVKSKKPEGEIEEVEEGGGIGEMEQQHSPLFSMYAPDNRPITDEDIMHYSSADAGGIRKIVVPYSQLMYHRFYDWPPENAYARVRAEAPPSVVPPPRMDRGIWSTSQMSLFSEDEMAGKKTKPFWRRRPRRLFKRKRNKPGGARSNLRSGTIPGERKKSA